MESLLFHPKVVHLPMALGVLMPLVAAALLIAWWQKWLPARAWLLAVGLQAILVVSGLMAMRSGEAEEERVEGIVAEQHIEAHEEAAEVFVWASAGVLALMVAAAALRERKPAQPVAALATLGTLLVLGLGYQVGEAGGRLVYQHGAAGAYTGGAAPAAPAGDADDD